MTSERNPLLARLEEVMRARGLSARAWSLKAGLGDTYLKQQKLRAEESAIFVLPEKNAPELARAAGVSVEWLRFGRGAMDPTVPAVRPTSDLPPPGATFTREPKATELAVSEAFTRAAGRFEHRVLLAALDLVRRSDMMLPTERELAVIAAEGLLAGVAEVQRREQELTYASLVGALLSDRARAAAEARDKALNAEGDADLAALGASRPAVPVRTPARPLRAVPSDPTSRK